MNRSCSCRSPQARNRGRLLAQPAEARIFGMTAVPFCLNLVHRTSIAACNSFVLFCYFGEAAADQPSERPAIARSTAGRLGTPLPLEFGNGVITGIVPRLPDCPFAFIVSVDVILIPSVSPSAPSRCSHLSVRSGDFLAMLLDRSGAKPARSGRPRRRVSLIRSVIATQNASGVEH
jgi:hypothetical protein